MSNSLKVIGGIVLTGLVSGFLKKGSKNKKYNEVTWEELKSIKLKPNQFWHGITVFPITEHRSGLSKQEQLKKSLEFLESSRYTVSRHPKHNVEKQQGLTPDDGTYMSKDAGYVSEYANPFFAILEIPEDKMKFLKIDELVLGDPVFWGGYSIDVLEQTAQSRSKHQGFRNLLINVFRRYTQKNPSEVIPMSDEEYEYLDDTSFDDPIMMDVMAYLDGEENLQLEELMEYTDFRLDLTIGKRINKEGFTPEEKAQIDEWVRKGEVDIDVFFMPSSAMKRIPIKYLYKVTDWE